VHNKPHELTLRVVVIAIILTLILATANAFLALKLGMLTSASIPAAILSMGILRFFKNANIWENNLIQTAASAGEAVAGGIVYTIPALIIIGFWQDFSYWTNFFLALSSGCLGVLFSVPLRKSLVHHPGLPFPEGRAIAAILQNQTTSQSFKVLLWGLGLGCIIDFAQTGLHLIANQWILWFKFGPFLMVMGMGFAVAMMSAGFLIGLRMALSIAIGLGIVSFILLPFLGYGKVGEAANLGPKIWNEQIRYVGIGALLLAGIISLLSFLKPLTKKMLQVRQTHITQVFVSNEERDIPKTFILGLVVIFSIGIFYFLSLVLPIHQFGLKTWSSFQISFLALLFILIIGFLMSVVTAYFSAMVGVSASPGSSVVISSLLLAAWGILWVMHDQGILVMDGPRLAAEAIAIILASMVTGIAAIANDNMQDLKVGQLIGASPWRQQVMLMLGVLVSASIIPAVMKILYHVYGFSGKANALPAPTAFLLATLTKGFFQYNLPWQLIGLGASLMLVLALMLRWVPVLRGLGLSIFGVAIGIYLPLGTSTPLILGGCLAYVVQQRESKFYLAPGSLELAICLACGLVAGSAVMDVILAFYFALIGQTEGLVFLSSELLSYAPMWTLGLLSVLIFWICRLRHFRKI
jgi:putative OPT family oligopeptide transporter